MNRTRLRLLALSCGVLPVALSSGTAHAFWSTSGSATSLAATANLVAGGAPTVAQAGATLSLAWPAAATAPAGSAPTYALEREVAGSGAWTTVCGPSTARTCTHTPAQDGTYAFRVRVLLGSWTSLSAVSSTATVTVFVAKPSTPVLAPGDDTGSSATDGVTSVAVPRATGTAPAGSTVLLLIDGVVRASQVLGAAQTSYSLAVPLPDGSYQVTVRATMNGTSSALSGALSLTVDTAAPVLTGLVRQTPAPTNAATVLWTATLSEPVTGVDPTDFALTSSGLTGIAARPSAVSGGPTAWTLAAGTGAGDGTLGVSSLGDGTIVDLAGNSLRGHVVGEAYVLDRTAPLVLAVRAVATGPALTDGDVEVGDSIEVQFDEPMAAVPTGAQTLTLSRAQGRSGTLAAITGLTAPGSTFDPGGDYNSAKSTVTLSGLLSLSADRRTVVFTVGQQVGCTAKGKKTVCATVTGSAAPVTGFLPAATLTDVAGNGAAQVPFSQPAGTATLLF